LRQAGELRRLLALENTADIDANLAILVHFVRSIAHQSAGYGIFTLEMDGGYRVVLA
jgi:hypothetical protein